MIQFSLKQISQHWFGENERTLSTSVMVLSGQLGQVLGLGITPFIVTNYEYVPRMNIIWLILATLGSGICFLKVLSRFVINKSHMFQM